MCCKDFLIVCCHRRVESWRIESMLQRVKTRQWQSTGEIAVALNRVGASERVLYPRRTFLRYRLLTIYRY